MLVRDGSLAAAIGTLGGVCLLRCGPLWSRALDLARPTLAQAPDSKRGALCIQRCLESAARDLLPEEEKSKTDSEEQVISTSEISQEVSEEAVSIYDLNNKNQSNNGNVLLETNIEDKISLYGL